LLEFGAGAVDLFLRHGFHVGIIGRARQHFLCAGQLGFALPVAGPAAGHRGYFGVFA